MAPEYAPMASPRRFLTRLACLPRKIAPCCSKVVEATPNNQTNLNIARVSYASERHRLAQGEFPGNLADFSPRFIDTLAHDLVTDLPLNYIRMGNNEFVPRDGLESTPWPDAPGSDPAPCQ